MQCWWWQEGLYPNTCNSYLAEAGTENRITLTIKNKLQVLESHSPRPSCRLGTLIILTREDELLELTA